MASIRAVEAVCEAIVGLLRIAYRPEDFNNELEFKVYLARDFTTPMTAGVSLFLYRVFVNGTHRSPAGRQGPDGRRYQTELPVDLHFLLTAWGKDASLQHAILGWAMRVLEDTPVLPAGLLNAVASDVFRPDETVEVVFTDLKTEDLFHMWEALVPHVYQLSIPYMARNVRIESRQLAAKETLLQERSFDHGLLDVRVSVAGPARRSEAD